MAWTYSTLKQAIQDYVESDETTFVTNLPVIIQQAEDRILKSVQLPNFRKNSTGAMTASDQYLAVPTDYLASYSLAVGASASATSAQSMLLFKEVSFVREAFPDSTVEGKPQYYSVYTDEFFLLAPTPDVAYHVEIHYFYRPVSIVFGTTSWLGTHAEATLLWSCLYEAQVFLKGDADELALAKERFETSLANLKFLGEGRNATDSYRNG